MKYRVILGSCLLLLFSSARPAVAQTTPAAAKTVSPDKIDALATAARQGDVATVKTLLDEGVDVNTKFRYGATALSFAADHGHLEVVKLLLERGADVNVKDTFYNATPLTWASSPAHDTQTRARGDRRSAAQGGRDRARKMRYWPPCRHPTSR